MHNPIPRVRDKVREHKTKIVFTTGVVTGATGLVLARRIMPLHIVAPIDGKTLQDLIDDKGLCSYIDPMTRVKISLFNAAHLENK